MKCIISELRVLQMCRTSPSSEIEFEKYDDNAMITMECAINSVS